MTYYELRHLAVVVAAVYRRPTLSPSCARQKSCVCWEWHVNPLLCLVGSKSCASIRVETVR